MFLSIPFLQKGLFFPLTVQTHGSLGFADHRFFFDFFFFRRGVLSLAEHDTWIAWFCRPQNVVVFSRGSFLPSWTGLTH